MVESKLKIVSEASDEPIVRLLVSLATSSDMIDSKSAPKAKARAFGGNQEFLNFKIQLKYGRSRYTASSSDSNNYIEDKTQKRHLFRSCLALSEDKFLLSYVSF